MDAIAEYFSGSPYRFYLAAGVGLAVIAVPALLRYFGGGVCRSQAKLSGKTAIITGANTGIGLATAVDFAKRGARVVIACRDARKGEAAVKDIKERSQSSNVAFTQLDLASLRSVRECSKRILAEEARIDILINNAGISMPPYSLTEDGFEMQFGVNHLGHFLLTNLLLERIKESPAGRIVTVSSSGHTFGNINFDDLQSKQSYSKPVAYGQSKIANILFTRTLAKKLKGTNVTAYSLHPGAVVTELGRHFPTIVQYVAIYGLYFAWKSPWQGAQTTIHCAVTEGIEHLSGQYFSDCKVKKVTHPQAKDDTVADRLWTVSAQLVGLETE